MFFVYLTDLGLLELLCELIFVLPVVLLYSRFFRKSGWKRIFLLLIFEVYICVMFNVVGIPSIQHIWLVPAINLIPFSDFGSSSFFFGFSMNVLMFVPFGFLLPLLWKSMREVKYAGLAGFCLSLLIEVSQMFSFRATDIDDLIANTLGAVLGYWVWALIFGRRRKSESAAGAEKGSPIGELIVSIAVPFLVFLFLRTPVTEYLYAVLSK